MKGKSITCVALVVALSFAGCLSNSDDDAEDTASKAVKRYYNSLIREDEEAFCSSSVTANGTRYTSSEIEECIEDFRIQEIEDPYGERWMLEYNIVDAEYESFIENVSYSPELVRIANVNVSLLVCFRDSTDDAWECDEWVEVAVYVGKMSDGIWVILIGYEYIVEESEAEVNHTPTARIVMVPADGKVGVGEELTLSGHLSRDPDGDPLAYNWDFGDGNTSSGLMTTHTWGAEGNYSVTLTVRDHADATDSDIVQVTVSSGSNVYTDERSGDVQCQTGGSCNSDDQQFPVEADATRVALGWNLTDDRTLTTSEVSISVFNGTGDEIFNNTYNEGNFSVEFSGGQVDIVGDWTWRIEAEAGAMSYELSIRVEY